MFLILIVITIIIIIIIIIIINDHSHDDLFKALLLMNGLNGDKEFVNKEVYKVYSNGQE